MHVYSPTDDEAALKQFQGDVSSRFSTDANVVMGRLMMKAGGPHPCSQFEVGTQLASLIFCELTEPLKGRDVILCALLMARH